MKLFLCLPILVLWLNAPAARAADRVVSLAPNFTEILFAIEAGESVLAVSDYCQYPEEAQTKPRVGGPFNLNYELLVALQPDLVVLPLSLAGVSEKASSLGLPVLALANEKVDEVIDSIERLGEVTGKANEARRLADGIRERLREAETATRDLPRKRVLIVVLRSPEGLQDLTVASRETFLDELLRLAGGVNVVGTTLARYPRVSKEKIIELDPEVIFDLTFTAKDEDTLGVWSRLPTLTAVRTGNVIALSDPAVTVPGPRMVDTLARFLEILHPELADGAGLVPEPKP
jgi:iron complex transport system substrate-binding protein